MNNVTWYQGQLLKRNLTETRPDYGVPQLAVAMILLAREQGLTLEEIVQQLILANEFDVATTKLDRAKTISELGY
jgi:hypothetical protein